MSLRRIRRGELVLLVAVALLLCSSRLPWFGVEVPAGRDAVVSVDGRDGLAPLGRPWLDLVVLAGLSWVAIVVLAVRSGAGRATYGAVTAGVVGFFATAVALLVALLRVLADAPGVFGVADGGLSFAITEQDFAAIEIVPASGAWLGLAALLLGVVGTWLALADDRSRAAESRAVPRPPVRPVPAPRPVETPRPPVA